MDKLVSVILIALLVVKELDVNNKLRWLWLPIAPLMLAFTYNVVSKVMEILATT